MAAANAHLFQAPASQSTYLRARGFDPKSGTRSGGIRRPVEVDLPPGAVLFRTYQDPTRLFGEWWFTPHEMAQVVGYFGRDGPAFGEGRAQGKGILQATLAVRHEWGGNSPGHLGLLAAVRLTAPLKAYFGEGDAAPDASQRANLKPIHINDQAGRRRGVRQLFLPEAWAYQPSFAVIERNASTDRDLARIARAHGGARLTFET